jgi:hypothetical protein
MTMKATTVNGSNEREAGYIDAIEDCVKEMAAIRKDMKKTDAEIQRLRASSRRKLDETWAIIRRVEATI